MILLIESTFLLILMGFLIPYSFADDAPLFVPIEAEESQSTNAVDNGYFAPVSQFSLIGTPYYPSDFTVFDYANINAPKGGTIKFAEIGTFDNFNPYARGGVREANISSINESLFRQSLNDTHSYYPLLAQSVQFSKNNQSAIVTLNPLAYFSDGHPVTAEDVEFTFTKFMTEGVSQYRRIYHGVSVKALNELQVEFILPEPNRELLFSFVGDFIVLPKHFWQDNDLSKPLKTIPIGSGPYVLHSFQFGQWALYERNPNYWGNELPVNQGMNNFDFKRYDYYLDDNVALQAFKSGEYDIRLESSPKNWNNLYTGKAFDDGRIIKEQYPIETAISTQWLAFNLEHPLFQDRNVRKALTLAFDFNWNNKAFNYNQNEQPLSFFHNTIYQAIGTPSELELSFLMPYQNIIPNDVFGTAYHLPETDGSGINRQNLLTAQKILYDAGWIVNNQKLVHKKTGVPFEFEILIHNNADNRYILPFKKNLEQLGMTVNIKSADYNQMINRLRKRDFDMIPTRYSRIDNPSSDLLILWGSDYLSSTWNTSGLHNQAIDELIKLIPEYVNDEEQFIALGRAIDRVLMFEYPMIPVAAPKYRNLAYWNKFGKSPVIPKNGIGIDSWWSSDLSNNQQIKQ